MTTLSRTIPLLLIWLLTALTTALPTPPTMAIMSSLPATPSHVNHTDWSDILTKQYCSPNQNSTHTCQLFVQSNNMIAPGTSDIYVWDHSCNILAEKKGNKFEGFNMTSILVGGYEITVLPGGGAVSILTDNGALTRSSGSEYRNSVGWSEYVKVCKVLFPC